jgi:hypothetical protein
MKERWQRSNLNLAQIDQIDIYEQGHFRSSTFVTGCSIEQMRQLHPEFSASCYNRIRLTEEAFKINNYFENAGKN